MSFRDVLANEGYDAVAAALDAIEDGAERVAQIRSLPGSTIRRLWDLAEGHPVELEWFLPAVETETTYAGRNSMPLFSEFAKVFWRPKDGAALGMNRQLWSPFTGPGYFTCTVDDGTLAFDYRKLPAQAPPTWPKIRPANGPISFLVYGNMVDFNRRLGARTIVGHATRGGRSLRTNYVITRTTR